MVKKFKDVHSKTRYVKANRLRKKVLIKPSGKIYDEFEFNVRFPSNNPKYIPECDFAFIPTNSGGLGKANYIYINTSNNSPIYSLLLNGKYIKYLTNNEEVRLELYGVDAIIFMQEYTIDLDREVFVNTYKTNELRCVGKSVDNVVYGHIVKPSFLTTLDDVKPFTRNNIIVNNGNDGTDILNVFILDTVPVEDGCDLINPTKNLKYKTYQGRYGVKEYTSVKPQDTEIKYGGKYLVIPFSDDYGFTPYNTIFSDNEVILTTDSISMCNESLDAQLLKVKNDLTSNREDVIDSNENVFTLTSISEFMEFASLGLVDYKTIATAISESMNISIRLSDFHTIELIKSDMLNSFKTLEQYKYLFDKHKDNNIDGITIEEELRTTVQELQSKLNTVRRFIADEIDMNKVLIGLFNLENGYEGITSNDTLISDRKEFLSILGVSDKLIAKAEQATKRVISKADDLTDKIERHKEAIAAAGYDLASKKRDAELHIELENAKQLIRAYQSKLGGGNELITDIGKTTDVIGKVVKTIKLLV